MDEVPPLEDVPEVLERLQKQANEVIQENEKNLQDKKFKERQEVLQRKAPPKQSTSNFGGLKKGFLFGGVTAKSTKQDKVLATQSKDDRVTTKTSECAIALSKAVPEDIPFIQARDKKSDLVLKEVQEAMVEANVAHEFQDKLSQRLETHSEVKDVLSDPEWLPILDEFQQDPEAAMIKYKNNDKVKNTLLQLCNVLGDTFLHMEKSNKTEEEKLSGELMNDPHVKEALTDPLVMNICKYMKEGANDKVHRCIQTANTEQKRHIQTLIDFGLFSFSM